MIMTMALLFAGCASIGSAELTHRVSVLDQELRDNVHVYLINSPLDQFAMGRLGDVAGYLRKAGFANSSYRHWSSGGSLAKDLLELRERNPDARIALIGWSGGSLVCWDAATELAEHEQVVDCVMYLDSNWIKGRIEERGHPDNIIRLVLIYRQINEPPAGLPAARVYRIPTNNHMSIPAHDETIDALVDELIATATQSRL